MISSPKRRRKQAGADPPVPVGRSAGGDDRRRHQRRARAGSGRRGGSHELRHPCGEGSGQHGRPDSNPTKLIEVVHIGKQMLMTRGSLTTFSIANDVAKYFAIIPAAFAAVYPQLAMLNVMGLHSPSSAILSAVIFNALIIVFLIPAGPERRQLSPALRLGDAAPQPVDLRHRRSAGALYRY